MGRLSQHLQGDTVYQRAGENFKVSADWSADGGYGQHTVAASRAHLFCRAHVKEHDGGYRTPLSLYWGKFKEAYYIMEAEHKELGRMARDRGAMDTIVKLRNFNETSAVRSTYQYLVKEADARGRNREAIQIQELVTIAKQEQINVLQPLIYNDPLLKETMDTNHRFSRMTNGWVSPKFKVIFKDAPTNTDPAFEAVFDAPENMLQQMFGTTQSLPNQENRMKFVAQIADKFNKLMKTQRQFMESELKKIAGWVHP